jgi:hypothetical protein
MIKRTVIFITHHSIIDRMFKFHISNSYINVKDFFDPIQINLILSGDEGADGAGSLSGRVGPS